MVDENIRRKLKRIWCERLIMGLVATTALGCITVQAPKVYNQVLENLEQQAQAQKKQEKTPENLDALVEANRSLQRLLKANNARLSPDGKSCLTATEDKKASKVSLSPDGKYIVTTEEGKTIRLWYRSGKQLAELKLAELKLAELELAELEFSSKGKQNQQLMQDAVFLGLAAIVLISTLVLLSKQRNKVSLTLTGQLILFIPEECVAELGALHEHLKSEQHSVWLIRGIILWNFLALLWAFYVQINLDNLRLPQNQGRKKIDD